MKKIVWVVLVISSLSLLSCHRDENNSEVVSQRYVHKYGFDVSPDEWNQRDKEGQIITTLENGVTLTQSFANGILHGPSSYTYSNSSITNQVEIYDEGVLLKTIFHDSSGIPYKEELYEFDNRKIITLWDNSGIPLSIEEYDDDILIKGQYYNGVNTLEAAIEEGRGVRIKRDRKGQLLSKDSFDKGQLTHRTTYHPSGQVQSESSFDKYVLHGKQTTFSQTGNPLVEMYWDHGLIDGTKVVLRHGKPILKVPYVNGERHGIEREWDDDGNVIAEIRWENDVRHGSSRFFDNEDTIIEWYYNGKAVSLREYHMMENRDQMVAELYGEKESLNEQMKERQTNRIIE
jgi:antitoxin component YwqK of YwqJK toxin-antitoxin module